MSRRARGLGCVALAGALLLGGGGALASEDELPAWPHEQQAMLRQVEDDVIALQRKMFKARQQGDMATVELLNKQFREIQEKRHKLIDVTKDQLPSE